MTLDGRIASRSGESKWISNEASRAVAHRLRGRMDAIAIGIGTALADDPRLTARPAGPRVATRIVFDSQARLPIDSQLVRTAGTVPLIVVVGARAPSENIARLRGHEVEVIECVSRDSADGGASPDPRAVLAELGRRRMTNVLVEGGSQLLGAFFDAQLIDEVHVFIAPKLLGGKDARSPLAGVGCSAPPRLPDVDNAEIEVLDGDIYVHGPLRSSS
jgi:diaminohydroxyphosphoribosylaminopyrimidine deaminase/5-amino-6-(5-phosphoribosylamino)uracil reductase